MEGHDTVSSGAAGMPYQPLSTTVFACFTVLDAHAFTMFTHFKLLMCTIGLYSRMHLMAQQANQHTFLVVEIDE